MDGIRNISDTALWAALYRAGETERADALFRDPFARRLAGERGARIAVEMRDQEKHAWAWVMRTYSFDRFIAERLRNGTDMVINLAAGLDARPYRMDLPADFHWVEVDLPDLVAYKESILRDERPRCRLERVSLDLGDAGARRALFARLGAASKSALVLTEGLLIYLTEEEVIALGEDLAAAGFRHWIFDLASPGLMRLLQKEIGKTLSEARAPLKFAPAEGPEFFERAGWRVIDVASTIKTAAKLRRGPLFARFFAIFPEPKRPGSRPWGGVCMVKRGD